MFYFSKDLVDMIVNSQSLCCKYQFNVKTYVKRDLDLATSLLLLFSHTTVGFGSDTISAISFTVSPSVVTYSRFSNDTHGAERVVLLACVC